MQCPHCRTEIENIIGVPDGVTSCLTICSECKEVVKFEDNEVSKLSFLEKIRLDNILAGRVRNAQFN